MLAQIRKLTDTTFNVNYVIMFNKYLNVNQCFKKYCELNLCDVFLVDNLTCSFHTTLAHPVLCRHGHLNIPGLAPATKWLHSLYWLFHDCPDSLMTTNNVLSLFWHLQFCLCSQICKNYFYVITKKYIELYRYLNSVETTNT